MADRIRLGALPKKLTDPTTLAATANKVARVDGAKAPSIDPTIAGGTITGAVIETSGGTALPKVRLTADGSGGNIEFTEAGSEETTAHITSIAGGLALVGDDAHGGTSAVTLDDTGAVIGAPMVSLIGNVSITESDSVNGEMVGQFTIAGNALKFAHPSAGSLPVAIKHVSGNNWKWVVYYGGAWQNIVLS